MRACLRIGVFETCLKVFGVPFHKVDPKGAKCSVLLVKSRFNLLLLALLPSTLPAGLKYPQSYDPCVIVYAVKHSQYVSQKAGG